MAAPAAKGGSSIELFLFFFTWLPPGIMALESASSFAPRRSTRNFFMFKRQIFGAKMRSKTVESLRKMTKLLTRFSQEPTKLDIHTALW